MSLREATFRLLDRHVGWHELAERVDGLESPQGVGLALDAPDAIAADRVSPWLPPTVLAAGDACDRWYLATARGLLRWDAARVDFGGPPSAAALADMTAVDARGHRVVVARARHDEVLLFGRQGFDLIARLRLERPGPVLMGPCGETLVYGGRPAALHRFSAEGMRLGTLRLELPPGRVMRLAQAMDRSLWLATRVEDGAVRLWRAGDGERRARPAALEALEEALPRTRVASSSRIGFTFETCHPDGGVAALPFDWSGRPLADPAACGARAPRRATHGQLLLGPIDSGIPRCRWHRVRIDAHVPTATHLTVDVATAERPEGLAGCAPDPGAVEWRAFAAGPPHPGDWQRTDALDLLVDQPPGRYLYLRLRLLGDGVETPRVRQIRLDFPRVTTLRHLPGPWSRDPLAEDFTERFLSLFDAGVEDTELAFERSPSLIDPGSAHGALLPWLAEMLDVSLDPSWSDARRRALLAEVPALYRRRGTLAGLARALELTLGVRPAILDRAAVRHFGALGADARASGMRLFGRHRARFTLDRSRLGVTPLTSHGEPLHDARRTTAHRVVVAVPHHIAKAMGADRIEAMVRAQKPAHVHAQVVIGQSNLVVGVSSRVGVDTLLQVPPRPILGGPLGNARLRHLTVLRPPRSGRRAGLDLGQGALARVGAVIH